MAVSSVAQMNECLAPPCSITHLISTYIRYLQMSDLVSLFLATLVRVWPCGTMVKLQLHLWLEAVLDLYYRNLITHVSKSIHYQLQLLFV